MVRKTSLTTVVQPQEYFRELVTAALGHQKVRTLPEAEFYLVNLLHQFMTTDHLYPRDGEGNSQEEPLALMMKDALDQPSSEVQRILFRQAGDVSLYVAGFFQESLIRKHVDVDYYIDMGGVAYRQVAVRSDRDNARQLYEELAQQFGRFVEVLAEVSEHTTQRSEKDLLRMYELWMKTGSGRAEKALKDAGIVPNQTIKKKLQ